MKLKLFHKLSYIPAIALILTLGSCTDDFLYDKNDCPVGEKATVSIVFNTPEREQFTRSALSDAQDNQVNSLWIGIFNAESGRCTTNLHIADGEHGFTAGDKGNHEDITLTDIPTVSGTSRIVAVANPDNQRGRRVGDNSSSDLNTLLNNVTDWDDYLEISVALDESEGEHANVQTPLISDTKALVMSGSFVGSSNNHTPNETWSNDLLNQTVPIYPGNQPLGGKVHLRRLLSHITFNIIPQGNIVDIEPLSWQVKNAPVYSWMHERTNYGNYGQDPSSRLQATNAGDALTPSYADNNNYKSSLIYTTTDFAKEPIAGDANNRTQYSFDFWMQENKRQGLESCNDYKLREKEYGGSLGALTDPDPTGTGNYGMSGVFVSLTGTDVTLNNMATYVDIPCVVTYIVDTDNANSGADKGGITLPEGAKRTAQMTYRVHLGYVGTTPNARDFNSYRNSSYTYNVKIQSLQNVVVEAFRKGDEQPGGFGTVTDVTDQYFDLDAHYNAFNIQLDEADLSSFSFSMVSYDGGTPHEIYGGLEKGSNVPSSGDTDYKYYTWIELLPTKGENVLASYPGTTSNSLLRLGDFVPKTDGTPAQKAGWYTVFVNEYVYENSSNEEGTNWRNYVNQPNRNVWINVTEKISADGASTYYKAKYAFTQKSIQSYYSTASSAGNTSALGAEHENENFGMNIRWTNIGNWSVGTTGGETETVLDNENGRWNAWLFARNASYGANLSWSNAVDFTKPQTVNAITNTNQTLSNIYPDRNLAQKTWTVPSVALINSGIVSNGNTYNTTATEFDPQRTGNSTQYYQGYYACMNRNRDLNGDGQISADEIRWFLPTSGQMLRLILGRNGLKTPIMDYPNKDLPYGSAEGHDVLFHYLTSDYRIIWTEEGMSSSDFKSGDSQYRRAPWELRCIRNLGTNLGATIQRNNRVNVAYSTEVDNTTKGGVVKPTHYYGSALRNPSTGPVQIHKTNDPLNRLAQYGFEIAPRGNVFGAQSYGSEESVTDFQFNNVGNTSNPTQAQYNEYSTAVNNTLCRSLDESTGRSGWRVPTQKEIVIMFRTTDPDDNKILNEVNTSNAYFCVTQEYWKNDDKNSVAPSLTPGPDYRFCTVAQKIAQAKNLYRLGTLRCVRDLTAAEANMSYSQIIAQTRARSPQKAVKKKYVKKRKIIKRTLIKVKKER